MSKANQRSERPSCFSDRLEKHKLGKGHWNLASCQVSSNSVQQFQRRSRKCLSQSEARAAILFFRSARKRQTWLRTLTSCFHPSFVEFLSAVSEEKSKMSQPIRGQGIHLVFPIGPKNTNLVEDVEILLPFKFPWIPFSGFRGEVENISANQRPGRQSCFSDRPEKHKHGSGRWDLASCQVSLNSVQRFQRRSRKCLSQSEARAAILFFRSAGKHKLCRGHYDLASSQVSFNSIQWFQRRSRKCLSQSEARAAILFFWSAQKIQTLKRTLRSCSLSSFVEFSLAVSEEKSKMWKVNDDGRRTDGQRMITIVHLSLRLRCTKTAQMSKMVSY